jgi:hypothetical protein
MGLRGPTPSPNPGQSNVDPRRDRHLDGSRLSYDYDVRNHEQFGSCPSHDDHGDDSDP